MIEDLAWASGTWVGWQHDRLFVLSLEVTSIGFHAEKSFCAQSTIYCDLVLAVFFSQMASQRVCLCYSNYVMLVSVLPYLDMG